MFPEYAPLLQENTQDSKTTLGKSFLFDFTTGDFVLKDGKLQTVEGVAALRVWIRKILKTQRFKFRIYETGETNEYGVTLMDLVNSGYPQFFIQAEIQREATEALMRNPEILGVTNFGFSRGKRTLVVSFNVNSIHGSIVEEVRF